jgi:hypothetical protein
MKRIIVLFLAFGLFATRAVAADAGLPEYIGNFAGRAATTAYEPLERATAVQQSRVRGFGFGGAEVHYSFAGEGSPVRFKAGQRLEFIVRVAAQDRDPQSFFQLFALKQINGERVLPMASGTMFGSTDTHHEQDRPFDAEKYGTNFFKIVPSVPLAPGEYGLGTSDSQTCFLFAVDP